jgi:hypothetical protein
VLIGGEECYPFDGGLAEIRLNKRKYFRLAAKGEAPPRITIGKSIFFRKSALIAWLLSREESGPTRICANGRVRKLPVRTSAPTAPTIARTRNARRVHRAAA